MSGPSGFGKRWRRVLQRMAWLGAGVFMLAMAAFFVAWWRSDNECGAGPRATPTNPMQAIVYCDYGTAEVLRLESIEKPVPTDEQLLVRVHAASLNPLDWHYMRGTPRIMRAGTGLRRPSVTRLGVDFSGTVEAIGSKVTQFKPGDEVFGARTGALAQYVVVREDGAVVPKPSNLTFEQAAGIPIAAITALQALRDKGKVQPGQKVLINGASGGVGTFAVQIAKSFGAEVTGVCSSRNHEMVTSLGADHVIDYTKEDFTRGTKRYDLILDNVGTRGLLELRRALTPKGTYVLIGGGGPENGTWIGPMVGPLKEFLLSPFVSQSLVMLMADMNKADLAVLGELMQSGKVTPVVDRRYTLSQTPEAIRYLEEGHARGKVIVTME